ncbi:hypothetical protein KIN20_008081 [Parelaphostrongylus tenuis]|uniref:Uncharacterized protein n=1 Tax=Parelaphostrongylus tenuis TaxID=148309 RepID=A0AAD5MNA7_PARTN|nr:hypothetical protein KIN20_008081 [Parelaphostrongylus tenuis]
MFGDTPSSTVDSTLKAHRTSHLSVVGEVLPDLASEMIVESDSSLVGDILCAVISLSVLENSRSAGTKQIVGTLTMKGVLFRAILVSPSASSTSLKLKPLLERQQIITSQS